MRVGLDIGTTNSAVAVCDRRRGAVELARFEFSGGLTGPSAPFSTFARARSRWAGARHRQVPRGGGDGRLIQSMKSLSRGSHLPGDESIFRTKHHVAHRPARHAHARAPRRSRGGRPAREQGGGRAAGPLREREERRGRRRWRWIASRAPSRRRVDRCGARYEPVAAAHYYSPSSITTSSCSLPTSAAVRATSLSFASGPVRRRRAGRILGMTAWGSPATRSTPRLMHKTRRAQAGNGNDGQVIARQQGPADAGVDLLAPLLRWHHFSFLKTRKNIGCSGASRARPITTSRSARSST